MSTVCPGRTSTYSYPRLVYSVLGGMLDIISLVASFRRVRVVGEIHVTMTRHSAEHLAFYYGFCS